MNMNSIKFIMLYLIILIIIKLLDKEEDLLHARRLHTFIASYHAILFLLW